MKTIVIDFETYYDQDYSLRKMTPVEYILDPRFECIGAAVKEGDASAFWLTPVQLVSYLKALPDKVCVVSHNALFDMCILAWRFDYVPHMMIDTMGMARAWLGHRLKSLALNSVAMYLGIGVKGDTVHKVVGMSAAAIRAAGIYDEYAAYSCGDADLCWGIYRKLVAQGFPASEIAVMDTVLRCAVQPKFQLDQTKLAEHLSIVQNSKQELLDRAGMETRDDLLSNEKFAQALRVLGVDPPMKTSLVTGKETYAFAKTDPDFVEMEEHENPDVQALVSARLGIKSTLEEMRTERLINIASLTWPGNQQALMPMPLRYSGAHTHRLSGDWKINMQNLPRGGTIRDAIIAPPGHTVIAVDASQIEARVVAWFCGQLDLVEQFAKGQDVYSSFASMVFNKPVNKKDNPAERFIGKTAILGLGFGLGWPKFQRTVKLQSKAQTGTEIALTDDEAARVIETYRKAYPGIPAMWKRLSNYLPLMTGTVSESVGPIIIERQRIRLPSGLFLNYHDLQHKYGGWWFTFGGKPKYVYGGKMLENIVQALARICTMDTAVRIRHRLNKITGDVQLNLQVHDELVYIVPHDLVKVVTAILMDEMRKRPVWAPDLPLDAEAGSGRSYGDAK